MYNLKIISCDKRLELYKYMNYRVKEGYKSTGRRGNDDLDKYEKEINSKRSRKDTLNKARNNIVRLIKCNPDMTTFITLTYKHEKDYKESKKDLNIFFTKLRKDYKNLKYLWVLEFGTKNKRLHYHVLCNIPIGIETNKSEEHKRYERDFSKKYWGHGFIDIRSLSQENNTNIALYVSVYITKSIELTNLEGYRVYGYSKKKLNKPIVITYNEDRSIEEILKDFKDYKINYSNGYKISDNGSVIYFDMEVNYENK